MTDTTTITTNDKIVQVLDIITKSFGALQYALPAILNIVQHYQELVSSGSLNPADVDKAKALLDTFEWKNWDQI